MDESGLYRRHRMVLLGQRGRAGDDGEWTVSLDDYGGQPALASVWMMADCQL